jgi:6-phosphogluconolactonase
MKYIMPLCLSLASIFILTSCNQFHSSDEYYLYVGTYTRTNSKGIYIYKFDAGSGHLDSLGVAAGVKNPSFLAVSPNQKYLYAVNEMGDSARASVSSFAIDRSNGKLTFLNKQPSRGGFPCFITIDSRGEVVFVANYGSGSFTMLPVKSDGSLGKPEVTVQEHGSSVNPQRQQKPYVHCTILSPDESQLFVADLGTNKVSAYDFNDSSLHLSKQPSFVYKAKPGAGPRHLKFHPNGKFAYLITELSATITAFDGFVA